MPLSGTAQTVENNAIIPNSTQGISRRYLSPVNLVFLAYRGYFKQQGIPSYDAFKTALRSGKVNARDIIESAVSSDYLSPDILDSQRYLHSVELALISLTGGG